MPPGETRYVELRRQRADRRCRRCPGTRLSSAWCRPASTTWIRGRSSATTISSVGGTGVAEAISFTPTVGGFAGIVITNKTGGFGGYTVYNDRSAPEGSAVINLGAAATTSPQVSLFLSASDPQTGIGTILDDDAVATVPGIGVTTRNFNFGSTPVGQSSVQRMLVISSAGAAPLAITSIRVSGDFSETSNCPRSLVPGASCMLTGNFRPAAAGVRTGNVTLVSNAPDSPTVAQLRGTGT